MSLLKVILYRILIFFYKLSKKKFYQSLKIIENFKLDIIIEYFKKNNSLEHIYDIGSHNGSFSLERNEKSLKNKKFYLFDVNHPHKLKKI